MNLYLRYFDKETLVYNVEDALDFFPSGGFGSGLCSRCVGFTVWWSECCDVNYV